MPIHFHTKLQASALSYTLAICLLIGTLLSGMVLLFGMGKQAGNQLWFQEIARDNMESGIQLALHQTSAAKAQFSLFDSPLDSAYTQRESWGLYGLVHATGIHGPAREQGIYLYGSRPEAHFKTTLFLSDLSKSLHVAGETRLEGELLLPQAGLRRGMVGNQGYVLPELHQGKVSKSTNARCQMDYSQAGEIATLMVELAQGFVPPTSQRGTTFDSIHSPWSQPATVLSSTTPLTLSDCSLSGKVIVISPEIWVTQSARLDQVILVGQSIFIEDEFEGRVQAFATDTLETGLNCRFSYPSVLLTSHPEGDSRLVLGGGSELEGMVIHDANFIGDRPLKKGYTLLDTATTVFGNVYVPFHLDLKGTVRGHTATYNFQLKTPGSVYENYLLDAHLTREGLSDDYAMGLVQPGAAPPIIIEALTP